jgi:hypothetical protein
MNAVQATFQMKHYPCRTPAGLQTYRLPKGHKSSRKVPHCQPHKTVVHVIRVGPFRT